MLLPPYDDQPITFPAVDPAFRRDVLAGLAQKMRTIPPRWFYDLQGSELFEKITTLPEYYLTRAEHEILMSSAGEIARLVGRGRVVVEFGAGSSAKTRILLSTIEPSLYVPIDISGEFLEASTASLRSKFPQLPIQQMVADFMDQLSLPEELKEPPLVGFFPGSTIGNLDPHDAVDLLRSIARILGMGSLLLIGVDRLKGLDILVPAYDDLQGVTADFNLNLLHRINRELHGSIPVDAFKHLIRWNEVGSRIEMHLEAQRDTSFEVDGYNFEMRNGETIHTENSHKYSVREARLLLRAGGWTPVADWTDKEEFFSLILAQPSSETPAV